MKRRVMRATAAVLVGAMLTSTPVRLRAQVYDYLVYDDANWYQAVLQFFQFVEQFLFLLRQARRLPLDMASRYRGHAVDWTFHDAHGGLLYAQQILEALNGGDPSGDAYRGVIAPLDTPTDALARMPASLRRRLTNSYAAIELSDSASALAVDQMGALRLAGADNAVVVQDMENDAVSVNDDFHTQTALLNKINAATVLGLSMQEQVSKTLISAVEQLVVANRRSRDAEATLVNATIHQWRYGQAYGDDLFRNTARNIDGWRLR